MLPSTVSCFGLTPVLLLVSAVPVGTQMLPSTVSCFGLTPVLVGAVPVGTQMLPSTVSCFGLTPVLVNAVPVGTQMLPSTVSCFGHTPVLVSAVPVGTEKVCKINVLSLLAQRRCVRRIYSIHVGTEACKMNVLSMLAQRRCVRWMYCPCWHRGGVYDEYTAHVGTEKVCKMNVLSLLAQRRCVRCLCFVCPQAANMMRCDHCGGKHRRVPVDRPSYSARFCDRCNIHHSAKEVSDWWSWAKVVSSQMASQN